MRILFCLVVGLSGCRDPSPSSAPPPRSPSTPKSTATLLEEHGVSGWKTARLAASPTKTWIAAVAPEEGSPPKVILLATDGGKITRRYGNTAALFGTAASPLWLPNARWTLTLKAVPRTPKVMALSLTGDAGTDLEQRRDVLALLDSSDGRVLWVGKGAWETIEMGRCTTGQTVKMKSEGVELVVGYLGYSDWTEQTDETSQSPDYTRLKGDCRSPAHEEIRLPITGTKGP